MQQSVLTYSYTVRVIERRRAKRVDLMYVHER